MPVAEIGSYEEFDRLTKGNKVILIDFYADWCGPCKMISPIFHKLAEEHASRESGVEFYQVDIDKQGQIAAELGIRSIPTFHAYMGGNRLDEVVGASPDKLKAFVGSAAGIV